MSHNNTTCVTNDSGGDCIEPVPVNSAGLAVGLTLFFVILVIAAGALVAYTMRRRLMSLFTPGQTTAPLKSPDNHSHISPGDESKYTGMVRSPPPESTSIYENFSTLNNTVIDMNRSEGEPEDLYLQCDTFEEAIYGNELSCSLAVLPDDHDEDLYVVPDAL